MLAFLAHLGGDQGKYHETITRAWVTAVDHFKGRSPNPCQSAGGPKPTLARVRETAAAAGMARFRPLR